MSPRSRFSLLAVVAVLTLTLVGCRRPSGPPTPSTTATTSAPSTTRAVTTTAPATTTSTSTTTTTAPPAGPTPKTVKVRYGPFTVPDANSPGTSPFADAMPKLGATLENGMIWNLPVKNIQRPCDDCYLTAMQAGLEFGDGTVADTADGLWLHHMVLLASGPGKSDATCRDNDFSLPHIAVGGTGANTERIFASGNERTRLDTSGLGAYGYKLNTGDQLHLLVELMNTSLTTRDVYLTMEYAYVPGDSPGYHGVKPVWFDVAQCGTSEVPARTGSYAIASDPWTATFSGRLLGGAGHLHDGGTHLTFERNGTVFCDSVASYRPAAGAPEGGGHDHGGHDGPAAEHISAMSLCPAGERMAQGDSLLIRGYYDDAAHPQMVHDGKLHSIMAIGILYFATD